MLDKTKHGNEICLNKFFCDKVNFYKRKRMYIELLDNTKPILNHKKYFKSNLKKGKENIIDLVKSNLSRLKISDAINENFVILVNYLNIKALTKLNFVYEKYIEYAPQKHQENKNIKISKTSNSNVPINNINKISILDKNSSDIKNYNIDLENNNTEINLEIKTYINEQLYTFINRREDINPNIIKKINITGDGNCLYRSISFLYIIKKIYI